MPALIEYCVGNVPPEVRALLPPEAEASPCLMRCGLCHEGAFLAVDGDLRQGPSHAAILAEVGVSLEP
jgi:uncharacterized protein YuzB (UPF0349 family)